MIEHIYIAYVAFVICKLKILIWALAAISCLYFFASGFCYLLDESETDTECMKGILRKHIKISLIALVVFVIMSICWPPNEIIVDIVYRIFE